MKIFSALVFVIVLIAAHVSAQEAGVPKDQKEKLSYSLGLEFGSNLKRQGIDVNPDMVLQGVKDSLVTGKSLLTESEIRETITVFQKEFQAKQAERLKTLGEKNKKEGEAFLAENKKKEGIVTLPSGLQYKVVQAGTGKAPKASDTVTVHYRGTLIDGTEFDSSHRRGQPATFPVNGVIAGWTEALQLMTEGAKWQLFIPSNLAYGERGAGNVIGPHAVLVFDVELISVK